MDYIKQNRSILFLVNPGVGHEMACVVSDLLRRAIRFSGNWGGNSAAELQQFTP